MYDHTTEHRESDSTPQVIPLLPTVRQGGAASPKSVKVCLSLCMSVLPMYICAPRVCPGACGGQKKAGDPWGWSQGWSWEPTLGLLQEQQVILTAEPPLQSPQR